MNAVLRGPTDPDHYRVKKGNFSDRWYIDPLPADEIWPAVDGSFPSVSTVKKATEKNWSAVTIKRIARALFDNPRRLEHCVDLLDITSTLSAIDTDGLTRDGDRGTNVHLVAETLLDGRRPVILPTEPGAAWVPAVVQFFHDYTPTLVAAEVVVIHRDLHGWGYGGTFDAIVMIDGKLYLVDWKSRGGEHTFYPHEIAQLGGYYGAQYCIVTGAEGHAVRAPLPELEGGLIVSISREGYRAYPVDLKRAYDENFVPLHRYWVARRSDSKAVGKPWAPLPVSSSYTVHPGRLRERVTALIDRGLSTELQLAWPAVPWGQPPEAYTPDQLDAITRAVQSVEDLSSLPFHADDAPVLALVANEPETPVVDLEGGVADPSAISALMERATALSAAALESIGAVTAEANAIGVSLSLRQYPTVRRFEIGRALILLAEVDPPNPLDVALVRHLIAMVTRDPSAEQSTTPVGVLVARLELEQARQFAALAAALGTESLRLVITPGGAYSIEGAT